MKCLFAIVLGVVLVAAYYASTEAAPAADELHSVVDPRETEEGETTTVRVTVTSAPNGELPDDVLRRLFSSLAAEGGPTAMLYPASQVCRQWRRLSKDLTYWDRVNLAVNLAQTVTVDENELLDARHGARVLLGAPALRSLWLQGRFGFFNVAEDARFLKPALTWTNAFVREKLCVDSKAWAALGEDGRGTFLPLLRRSAPYLRELKLSRLDNEDGCVAVVADEDGRSVFDVLAGLQNLEKLELSQLNPSQTYAGELTNVVLPNLQHLRIKESHSVANSPKDFHADLVQAAASTLTSLQLDFVPSTSEALQGAVQSCQGLQSVEVIYPGPFPALGECTEIKELKVDFWNMKADQVGEILQECAKLDKLEKLELVVWGVEGRGSEEWSSAMTFLNVFKQQRPQVDAEFVL